MSARDKPKTQIDGRWYVRGSKSAKEAKRLAKVREEKMKRPWCVSCHCRCWLVGVANRKEQPQWRCPECDKKFIGSGAPAPPKPPAVITIKTVKVRRAKFERATALFQAGLATRAVAGKLHVTQKTARHYRTLIFGPETFECCGLKFSEKQLARHLKSAGHRHREKIGQLLISGMNLSAIGRRLRISRERVRQIANTHHASLYSSLRRVKVPSYGTGLETDTNARHC